MIDKVYNDLADLSIGRLQKGVRGKGKKLLIGYHAEGKPGQKSGMD